MKKIIVVVICLILVSGVFAQLRLGHEKQGNCEPGMRMDERGVRGENRDKMMAFMLSDRLDLSTKQADKFFPRFREHQETMEALRDEIRELNKDIFDKIKDNEEITDAELNKVLKDIQTLKDKQEKEKVRFIDGLDNILNNNQIAKLALAPKHHGPRGQRLQAFKPQNRR